MPGTTIAQLAKLIGQELESGAGPSEQALATGPMLAEAGATTEIVERLFAEAQRKRPNDRMIQAYAFIIEGALETLRLHANGGDATAEHEIAEIHNRVDHALGQGDFAPEMLMLLARAFARAELDPGRSLQEAMVGAMEARSHLGLTASSAEEISDHFAELGAELDNDPFAIYAELASTAAAFPAGHQAAMAGALSGSDRGGARGCLGLRAVARPSTELGGAGRYRAAGSRRAGVEQGGRSVGAHPPFTFGEAPDKDLHRRPCVASENGSPCSSRALGDP